MEHDHRPIGSYLALTAVFNAAAWGLAAIAGPKRPRMPLRDTLVLGAATHEVSRIVTKERVGRPLRRPFTEIGTDGRERPAGQGARRAIGELVTCPYCVAPWIALALEAAYLARPAVTRTVCGVLAIAAASSFLNRACSLIYAKRRELDGRAAAARAFRDAVVTLPAD